jgi:hypothetical protein
MLEVYSVSAVILVYPQFTISSNILLFRLSTDLYDQIFKATNYNK